MGRYAAAQSGQVVATFEHADNSALRITSGKTHELVGNPGVIVFYHAQLPHFIFAMCIEAGGYQDEFRLKFGESGYPDIADNLTQIEAGGIGVDRNVEHVGAFFCAMDIGVERMLEETAHHDTRLIEEDVFCAIAMVHVEIDDRYA